MGTHKEKSHLIFTDNKGFLLHSLSPTRHVQLSSSGDEFSGLRLVGSTHVNSSVVTPGVPNHQVGCEDNHVSGNGLPIWSESESAIEGDNFLSLQLPEKHPDTEAAVWLAVYLTCDHKGGINRRLGGWFQSHMNINTPFDYGPEKCSKKAVFWLLASCTHSPPISLLQSPPSIILSPCLGALFVYGASANWNLISNDP